MSIFSLYLISILDNFRVFLFIALIVSIFIMFLCIMFSFDKETGKSKRNYDWCVVKFGFLLFIIVGFFLIITPTTKSAVAVIAGHTVLEISNGEQAKSIMSKSSQILDKFLDEQLKNEKN